MPTEFEEFIAAHMLALRQATLLVVGVLHEQGMIDRFSIADGLENWDVRHETDVHRKARLQLAETLRSTSSDGSGRPEWLHGVIEGGKDDDAT